MRDLTNEILKSKRNQNTWSQEKLELLLKLWGQVDDSLKFDNDIESGELWVRVLKNSKVIGIIGVNIPLLIITDNYLNNSRNYDFFRDVHIVEDVDFNVNSWYIDLDTIKLSVPEITWRASQDAVNPECMSINDFWYATV